jgi:hypothetical protein
MVALAKPMCCWFEVVLTVSFTGFGGFVGPHALQQPAVLYFLSAKDMP